MSKHVLVTESYLSDIADAIREKSGDISIYKPGEIIANAIKNLSTATTINSNNPIRFCELYARRVEHKKGEMKNV